MQKIKKIGFLVFIICICWGVCKPVTVLAEEISHQKKGLNVTFVVDTSGSMRSNDRNELAFEMIKAFIDTVYTEDIKVGFVAYSDSIVASAEPASISGKGGREQLKALLDSANYSGNTDIGLGLLHAYGFTAKEAKRDSIIVLISDGDTDLAGSTTGRTLEQSNQDLDHAVASCRADGVPIYTIAFGQYGGSGAVLQQIADETKAESHVAGSPELLTEVLYGILNNSLTFKIQQFASETYTAGNQEIHCRLDEEYLSEIAVLLISPQAMGASAIQYGKTRIPMVTTSCYAVGRISRDEIDDSIKELTMNTATAEGQQVKLYVIGYRSLDPVLILEREAFRNRSIPYQVVFKDEAGRPIEDDAFYSKFQWVLTDRAEGEKEKTRLEPGAVTNGVINGEIRYADSGKYLLDATLSDEFGSYKFHTGVTIHNTEPVGSLPEPELTVLSKELEWNLDDFFSDADGDTLSYTLDGEDDILDTTLADNKITIKARKSGRQTATILVSDGELELPYTYSIRVVPLWQRYWWGVISALLIIGVVISNLLQRYRMDLEKLMRMKSPNRFNGRLDLNFTMLPEEAEELLPQAFHLSRLLDSRIRLSDLLKDYPDKINKLDLNQICLIARKKSRIALYHNSKAAIRMGNSTIRSLVWHNISFGDIIYITSPDGAYELKLHLVSLMPVE